MPEVGDDNPLWKPGTYPHDSNDGSFGPEEFWSIKVVTISDLGIRDARWLTALRCFSSWHHRIRFRSRTEARKWYWDTVLCHLPSYKEKKEGNVQEVRVTLIHVKPMLITAHPKP